MKMRLSSKCNFASDAIVRASLGIFVVTFLVKGIGYAEKIVLAYYFGTSMEVDVYNVISATILSIFVFFRELIEPGFLNTFLSARNKQNLQSAWHIFNLFARVILVSTILLTIAVELFPDRTVAFFAPGFAHEKKAMAVQIIRIAFPACIFLALSGLTNITLNAFKNFVFAASADLVFRGVAMLCLIGLTPYIGFYSAGVGLLIGAVAKLLVHLSKLRANISLEKVRLEKEDRNNIFRLTWPLLLGVSFSQFNTIVDNIFASYLQNGAISALSYSKKIVELPILIFPYLLSTVLFPYLSQSYIDGEHDKTRLLLVRSLKWIVICFVPLSIIFLLYSHPIVALIFQRGAFTEASTALTREPFAIYATGMLFFAIETVLVVYFFARNNTLLPILLGMACVAVNVAITYFTINRLGYLAIPLAAVVSKTLKVCILLAVVVVKDRIQVSHAMAFSLKVVAGSLLFYGIHLAFNYVFIFAYASLLMKLVHMTAACAIALAAYVFAVYRLRVFEGLPSLQAFRRE